jgi:hypothetical protein
VSDAAGSVTLEEDVMRPAARVPRIGAALALSVSLAALLAACGSSPTAADSPGASGSAAGSGVSAPAVSASATASASASVGAAGEPPGSCGAIPVTLIGSYIGAVATTRAVGQPPHGVSCEFANANASKILILNIGSDATPASFAASRAAAAQGGRTVTPLGGLGAQAFSISKNGVPGGVEVLTPQGQVFAVTADLPIAEDEALIVKLMSVF